MKLTKRASSFSPGPWYQRIISTISKSCLWTKVGFHAPREVRNDTCEFRCLEDHAQDLWVPQSTRTNCTKSYLQQCFPVPENWKQVAHQRITHRQRHATELESGSFGLAAGRDGSPLLTVTLEVCSAPVSPGTAYKGFVFCSWRKWLLLDCCKPILLKDILFVLIL